jgi:hypothetical protein
MKFGPGEVLTVAVAGVSMALVSFGWEQGGRNTNIQGKTCTDIILREGGKEWEWG